MQIRIGIKKLKKIVNERKTKRLSKNFFGCYFMMFGTCFEYDCIENTFVFYGAVAETLIRVGWTWYCTFCVWSNV